MGNLASERTQHVARPLAVLRAGILPAILLGAAALFILPDIPIDADVLKLAVLGLAVAPLLIVIVAVADPGAMRDWFRSTGGRLYLASILLAVVGGATRGAFADPLPSSVVDRVLMVGLSMLAAVLGVRAARRHPLALPVIVGAIGLLAACVALAQALGLEHRLSPPPEVTAGVKEIVATAGNSTRAGALLALATSAVVALLIGRHRLREATLSPRTLTFVLIVLSAALVLTQARGARFGVVAAVLVMLAARGFGRTALRSALIPLAGGALLAAIVAGPDVLLARKLPTSASILSGQDVTTNVRLALWSGTTDMVSAGDWAGYGLGRYRHDFPPFRDPLEAELPGLAGHGTAVWHPHNEWLLAAAEGGWLAGGLLLLFAALSLRRAWTTQREDEGAADLAALGILVGGIVLGALQDAWTSPATGLIVFAAAGYVWAPRHGHVDPSTRSRVLAAVTAVLVAATLAALAWPRFAGHHGAWSFVTTAEADGAIDLENFQLLVAAADAAPNDEDVQVMLYDVAGMLLRASPPGSLATVTRAVQPPLTRATHRLAALHAPGFARDDR